MDVVDRYKWGFYRTKYMFRNIFIFTWLAEDVRI